MDLARLALACIGLATVSTAALAQGNTVLYPPRLGVDALDVPTLSVGFGLTGAAAARLRPRDVDVTSSTSPSALFPAPRATPGSVLYPARCTVDEILEAVPCGARPGGFGLDGPRSVSRP